MLPPFVCVPTDKEPARIVSIWTVNQSKRRKRKGQGQEENAGI